MIFKASTQKKHNSCTHAHLYNFMHAVADPTQERWLKVTYTQMNGFGLEEKWWGKPMQTCFNNKLDTKGSIDS